MARKTERDLMLRLRLVNNSFRFEFNFFSNSDCGTGLNITLHNLCDNIVSSHVSGISTAGRRVLLTATNPYASVGRVMGITFSFL